MSRALVIAAVSIFALAAHADRPLAGDATHGLALLKAAGVEPRVDGAWLNAQPEDLVLKKLARGEGGFPAIESENVLDRWDALAALRSANTDLRDLAGTADRVFVGVTKLDDNAVARLRDQAKLPAAAIAVDRTVFGLYRIGSGPLTWVFEKDSRQRDKLKKNTKTGYVAFVKIPGFRGGNHEAAFALDPEMHIVQVVVRGPTGAVDLEVNQAAARFVGRGARGQYAELKPAGGAKALNELAHPLSDAYLLAAESIYMLEVAEREYFAFDD